MRKIPEVVWHGSFIPDGTELRPDGLFDPVGFVSTSELQATAAFFAGKKRWELSSQSGKLYLFQIRANELAEETRRSAEFKEGLVPTLREWRFFHPIPWSVAAKEREIWLPIETRYDNAYEIATYCEAILLLRVQ